MSLFAELRQRKVFKVGGAYLVVAWLAIQAASIAFPTFDAPAWALRVFILVVLLGFPLALVLAWVFDITPEGVKASPSPVGNKRIYAAAGVLVVLALLWYYVGAPAFRAGDVDAHAIAVLPFENMSGEKDNEYFSDGISEEILNVLAQTPGLKVAARTSSFSFKGKSMDVPAIAHALKVRMVLEGSVRKQGDRVRITAQLIDATNGFHVWSQTYDRQLKDVFGIQDEIAHAITQQLQVELGDHRAAHASASTQDVAAYDLYLKGLALWQRREEKNLRLAETDFRAALARDPKFAKAWAGIALTKMVLPDWSVDPSTTSYPQARDAAEHALALDPNLPEPYAVLGYVAYNELRYDTGRVLFQHALAIAPSFATGYQWFGESLASAGDLEGGLRMLQRAVELDPVSEIVRGTEANILFVMGRDEESLQLTKAVLADYPDSKRQMGRMVALAAERKDNATARAMLLRSVAGRGAEQEAFANALADALDGKGDVQAIARRIADMPHRSDANPSVVPFFPQPTMSWFLAIGRNDLAIDEFAWLAHQTPYVARMYAYSVHFDPLRCEPKFQQAVHDLGVTDPRVATVCAKKN